MIVCSCNVLTDHEIRNVMTAAREQSLSAHQVYGCLGYSVQCGRCARTVKRIMSEVFCAAGCAACAAIHPSGHSHG
jgi:bacterioferritin-associated ferredoxin